jgi:hypothetical protein
MRAMKAQRTRKPGAQKRASKKYPKIVAVPSSAEEIRAAYNFTPAEIRRAKRILASVQKENAAK